ncbi:MAG: ADP-ribosylglycohydrolase family protein [Alphaproteobacteria bacterium]|nr:ADP-ribosylglycohydrolase family protein [Alphaproteobacteria bacterium]MCB9695595.1 ADP-ribosylglycohydrolase family protein [Alphaproteobacteria bacterium]
MGDAVGLPFENLSAARVARRLRQGLVPGFVGRRALPSDDTAHAFATLQALVVSSDPDLFAHELARRLRWWLATLPPGIGLATLRALGKSWLGASPTRSGVASAGNGPLMRAPVLGAAVRDLDHAIVLTDASTRITHTDPRSIEAARAVTAAARVAATGAGWEAVLEAARSQLLDPDLVDAARQANERGPVDPTGFVVPSLHGVLFAIRAGRGDPRAVIEAAVRLGGDTDTIAAIAGGIVGAGRPDDVPEDWLATVWWQHDVAAMEELARRVDGSGPREPLGEHRLTELALHQIVLARSLAELGYRWFVEPWRG